MGLPRSSYLLLHKKNAPKTLVGYKEKLFSVEMISYTPCACGWDVDIAQYF